MARKARQRISYVLPLANSPGGHRLGVNSLAVDSEQSVLYSAGRDGVICAWDISRDLGQKSSSQNASENTASVSGSRPQTSSFQRQVQAHTHWVNDIILIQSNNALVSASSDITVKVWRPHAEDGHVATTIGLHSDYVKCLASPGPHSDWVASGGLDHKIKVWDLNGGGERLQLNAGEDENSAKGSVYALSVRGSIMASGGPEGIVRLWDSKSGKRITKFMGHTDNVRNILINEGGDTIMTASSDQTIKVWSMAAGRCMNTLTMHNDSVWSLYSDHPQLSVFYSSDRSGMIAKTDVRGDSNMDEGLSISVAQEHGGVNKVVVADNYIWTATSSSSINRWEDVVTEGEKQIPDSPRQQRFSSISTLSKSTSSPELPEQTKANDVNSTKIPLACVLKISNTAPLAYSRYRDVEPSSIYPTSISRKFSEVVIDPTPEVIVPYHNLPEETIEGQNGLIKHVMLNDRKRVLTLDTAGEVILWDLLKCVPVQSFGKRHVEDVVPEVNTMESVANWCGVDTRTGRLAVVLEEIYCFDAEAYADEMAIEEQIDFREDQRINLGKWVLRYLFANLIDEEIKRDETLRLSIATNFQPTNGSQRNHVPPQIQFPSSQGVDWQQPQDENESAITPRPQNGYAIPLGTPGLSIGAATPGLGPMVPQSASAGMQHQLRSTAEEGSYLENRRSHYSNPRTSGDYFSSNSPPTPHHANNGKPQTPGETHVEIPQSPSEPDKEAKSSSLFGKKFKMSFPKKLGGRSSSEVAKPVVVDDKSETSEKSSEKEDKIVEDNFYGVLQKIRNDYNETLQNDPTRSLAPGINPSLPNETPLLRSPPFTSIIIQEDRPDSGGVADLYRGTVRSTGQDADLIEKVAPMWLGELLLRNQIPLKEVVKVSFVLLPYEDLLRSIASADGNSRLNANRMLRAKKILSYVAERIEPMPDKPDPDALKPEEYLDLYCQGQIVPGHMTLATIRAHVWKTGGDVMLYYRSNGRRPELEARHAKEHRAAIKTDADQLGNGHAKEAV